MQKMTKKIPIRLIIQIFFFAFIFAVSINNFFVEKGSGIAWLSSASIHALCPFGGVETFLQLVTAGILVKKVHESAVVLGAAVLFLAIFLGPVFCGWVCPMGSIQEFLGKIGKKIFKKKYNTFVPDKLHSVFRYSRYLVLILVLYNTFLSGKLLFEQIDPYYALFRFFTGEVAVTAYIILGITLLSSLFVERPFCKYACPYGAFLGLTNKIRIFPIRRKDSTCKHCSACDKACPMNINISGKTVIRDQQCISCLKCTSEEICPVPSTVLLSSAKLEESK